MKRYQKVIFVFGAIELSYIAHQMIVAVGNAILEVFNKREEEKQKTDGQEKTRSPYSFRKEG